jgi:hypothetical protein
MKHLTIILFLLLTMGSFKGRAQEQQVIPDQLSTLYYWGFGIWVILFLFNLGYTIWDRHTALKPALGKTALREYSQKHSDLADILKTHGLL